MGGRDATSPVPALAARHLASSGSWQRTRGLPDEGRAARRASPPLGTRAPRAIARHRTSNAAAAAPSHRAGQYPKESRQTVVVLFLKFLDPTPSPPYHSRCAPSFRLRSNHATRAFSESSCYSSHLRSPSPRLCLLAGAPSRPVRAWRVPDQTLTECTTPESGPNSRLLHSRDLLHTGILPE